MNTIKKGMLWLYLLTKRLYKKPTFLVILVLIPMLVMCYAGMTQGESGILTIALYGEDALSREIFDELETRGPLIRYIRCDDEKQAKTLVTAGKADGAWIFPADLASAMDAFAASPGKETSFVHIYQRDDNVSLMMVKEHLCASLYPRIARAFYLDYVREEFPDLAHLSDEALMAYYDDVEMPGELFAYDAQEALEMHQTDYLLSPVRGMLAIVIVIGGLAAEMYFIRDREQGTFLWVPQKRRALPELGCVLVACLNVTLAATVTLMLVGMGGSPGMELVNALMYSLCVTVFSMMLRRLLGRIHVIACVMPLLVVTMLLVCPVFFDLGLVRGVQLLFPPTHYINGIYDTSCIVHMALHILCCGVACFLLDKLNRKS